MFFIFGTPRSGTTLLAQVLNAHPGIVVPHETDFIIPLGFLCDRVRDPAIGRRLASELIVQGAAFAASLGEFLAAGEVRQLVDAADYHPAAILDSLYSAVARKAGKRIAGDKSPNDLNFVRILHKTGALAAPVRVLHIVRDVRDVLVSLRRTGWAPDMEGYFARQWSHNNLYLHGALQAQPDRYLLLRYEDLVAQPEAGIQRACALLGVDFDPAMLAPSARSNPRYRDMPHHRRLQQPISADSVGQHRHALEPDLLRACERQAGEALQAFGYPASSAMP
jgi:hypothetical protein